MTDSGDLSLLADIVLPPAQDWTPLEWAAFFILPALLATLVVFLARKRRQQNIAPQSAQTSTPLQELMRIEQEWHNGTLKPRDAAYRIAAVLRIGMDVVQLTRQLPPSIMGAGAQTADSGTTRDAAQDARWQQLIDGLERIRYCPDGGQIDVQWFQWIRDWLQTKEPDHAGHR